MRVIRYYPEMLLQREALRSVSHNDGVHTAASRTTENIALRQLSPREEEDIDAVQRAIEDVGRQRDGAEVLRVVELVDWGPYTVQGAAVKLHMDRNTAGARRWRFIMAVARNLRYLK